MKVLFILAVFTLPAWSQDLSEVRITYLEQRRQEDEYRTTLVRQHRLEWSHRHYDYSQHPWVIAGNTLAEMQHPVVQRVREQQWNQSQRCTQRYYAPNWNYYSNGYSNY